MKLSVIVKEDGKYCVKSKDPSSSWSGGCFDTKEEAQKRLREVEYFKRQASSVVRRYLLSIK